MRKAWGLTGRQFTKGAGGAGAGVPAVLAMGGAASVPPHQHEVLQLGDTSQGIGVSKSLSGSSEPPRK